jgi:RNA polymerase sigma-70 factor (ECF subfamily)
MIVNELNDEFSKIYDETYKSIFGYVIGKIKNVHDTDDVLQTIYTALYQRMCNKGILPADQALKILYTSAKHEIGRYYGFVNYQKKLVPVFSEDDTESIEYELLTNSFIDKIEDLKILEWIWSFIREKDELTYRAFLLHYVGGLSFKECAKVIPCSYAAIVHRVYRMIEEVKNSYKED